MVPFPVSIPVRLPHDRKPPIEWNRFGRRKAGTRVIGRRRGAFNLRRDDPSITSRRDVARGTTMGQLRSGMGQLRSGMGQLRSGIDVRSAQSNSAMMPSVSRTYIERAWPGSAPSPVKREGSTRFLNKMRAALKGHAVLPGAWLGCCATDGRPLRSDL
ncbi:MAG: hypothetical protein EA377_05990 [Phycisphaerales bacterium]|nr:MAG: hypothetical protein EA377_05990 [Phycisphaerales bacterium]